MKRCGLPRKWSRERKSRPTTWRLSSRIACSARAQIIWAAAARRWSISSVRWRSTIPSRHRVFAGLFGQEPGVSALVYKAICLGLRGELADAARTAEAGVALARESEHPLTIAYTLGHANLLWILLADLPRAKATADENLAYSDANGIKTWQIYALGWRAMADALAGRHLEALDAIGQVLLRSAAAGTGLFVPFLLSGEIRSLLALGRHADCAARISEAKERMADSGERWIEADILRLEGDLHLAKGDMAAAERSYGMAIEVAIQQEAKLFELRAATSLARLWADQGERRRALDLLGAGAWLVHPGPRCGGCRGGAAAARRAGLRPARRDDRTAALRSAAVSSTIPTHAAFQRSQHTRMLAIRRSRP